MLWNANADLLEQAADLLAGVDDETFTRPAPIFDGQRIGAHMRHVIDFYDGLVTGIPGRQVDYDARERDPLLESDRRFAIERLRELALLLRHDLIFREDFSLQVSSEGASFSSSSLGRELQAVASHTVHHFALIAVLLRYFGFTVPSDFGVSKATLDYRSAQLAAHGNA
jgi:hypothetical protein